MHHHHPLPGSFCSFFSLTPNSPSASELCWSPAFGVLLGIFPLHPNHHCSWHRWASWLHGRTRAGSEHLPETTNCCSNPQTFSGSHGTKSVFLVRGVVLRETSWSCGSSGKLLPKWWLKDSFHLLVLLSPRVRQSYAFTHEKRLANRMEGSPGSGQ